MNIVETDFMDTDIPTDIHYGEAIDLAAYIGEREKERERERC